jgi:hypothetical protein
MAPEESNRDRERAREAERYRLAAIHAVEQLEWCIQYLYRLRKDRIAQAVARNRSAIIERAGLFR